MTSVRDRLTDAGYALGWSAGLPGAGILGPRRVPVRRGHRLAPPGPRVQVLEANLRRVTGPSATGKELRALSRQTMRSYARYWLEAFRLPVIGQERIQADMHVTGEENLPATTWPPAAG